MPPTLPDQHRIVENGDTKLLTVIKTLRLLRPIVIIVRVAIISTCIQTSTSSIISVARFRLMLLPLVLLELISTWLRSPSLLLVYLTVVTNTAALIGLTIPRPTLARSCISAFRDRRERHSGT